MPIRLLELFGGIGACSAAFDRLGIPYTIADYVEIDKYAVKSYNSMHNTNFEPQDISKWDKDIEVDVIMHGSPCQDFSIAGANKGGDKDSGTRSSLMYETIRIVEKLRPKYVIWENVKNLLGKQHRHNFDNYIQTMKDLGYDSYYKVLNAKDYGIPQNRERVFTISIRGGGFFQFPEGVELEKRLKDLLETEVDEKYYMSEPRIKHHIERKERCKAEGKGFGLIFLEEDGISHTLATSPDKGPGAYVKVHDDTDSVNPVIVAMLNKKDLDKNRHIHGVNAVAPTLTTMGGGGTHPKILVKENNKKGYAEAYEGDSINVLYPGSTTRRGRVQNGLASTVTRHADCEQVAVMPNMRVRRLTPLECWRLMGFDDSYYYKAAAVCSSTQLYRQAGNSIVVNVLEAIMKSLLTGTENKQITFFDLLGG